MVYLVCNKCDGYYELQPGEKVEDFDLNCNCGGSLHADAIKDKNYKEREMGHKLKPKGTTLEVAHGVIWFVKVAFLLFAIGMTIIFLIIFIPFGLIMLLGTYGIYKILFDKKVELVSCPNCGYRISDKAILCPKCGIEFKK